MAKKKKMVFGANEKATENLKNTTDYSAPQNSSYPITFGKGEWTDGVFATIAEKGDNDSKIRFVYDVSTTNSGAIYAGNKLVSSKILDLVTNASDGKAADEVIVKFIGDDNEIQETKFNIVDPSTFELLKEQVEALQDWALDDILVNKEGNGAIDVSQISGDDEFKQYAIGVNVDDSSVSDISIVNNALTVSKYKIEKVGEPSDEFSAQYKLMVTKPDGSQEQAGETINIFKDFFLKDAHVCTFNKNADGSDYVAEDNPIIGSIEVYSIVIDEKYADVILPIEGGVRDSSVYLEKAPTDKLLRVNHTYLHLIVNTSTGDEIIPEGNDTTTDVFLDFTDILESGGFAELTQEVVDISTRVSTIEGSYIKEINIPESSVDEQFKTITITTSVNGESIDSSFDIADTSYYELVASNFETLNADCSTFASSLTWKGLD